MVIVAVGLMKGGEDAAMPDCHSLISNSLGPEGWTDQSTGVVFSDPFSFFPCQRLFQL